MTWEALGAIGEIVGALGVVASLFYVAYQVKQNTKQSKLSTDAVTTASAETANRAANEFRLKVAGSESLSRIYTVGMEDPEALTADELARFRLIMVAALHNAQMIFEAYRKGINVQQWVPTKRIVARLILSPGGTWVWENYSSDFSEEFQAEIDLLPKKDRISDNET